MSAALVQEVEHAISLGESGATLIPWLAPVALFAVREHDPAVSTLVAADAFTKAGWSWDQKNLELDKCGWYAFFRSQGELSPPIIQWQRRKQNP